MLGFCLFKSLAVKRINGIRYLVLKGKTILKIKTNRHKVKLVNKRNDVAKYLPQIMTMPIQRVLSIFHGQSYSVRNYLYFVQLFYLVQQLLFQRTNSKVFCQLFQNEANKYCRFIYIRVVPILNSIKELFTISCISFFS